MIPVILQTLSEGNPLVISGFPLQSITDVFFACLEKEASQGLSQKNMQKIPSLHSAQ